MGHAGLYFWLRPSGHLSAQCRPPWHCSRIKALSVSGPLSFCWWCCRRHPRGALKSPVPSRKLIRVLSERLLSCLVVEQMNCKGNIFPRTFWDTTVERKSKWSAKMLQGWGFFLFPHFLWTVSFYLEIYKITGIIRYHRYSAIEHTPAVTHIKAQNTFHSKISRVVWGF